MENPIHKLSSLEKQLIQSETDLIKAENEIKILKKELYRERFTVDFYANRDRWTCSFVRFQDMIPHSDCDAVEDDPNPALMQTIYGGVFARETQKQRKVELCSKDL